MAYLIIATWDANFHPDRTNTVATTGEADAIITKLTSTLPAAQQAPNAFYVADPGIENKYIVVDPLTSTITTNTTQQTADDLAAAIAAKTPSVDALRTTKLKTGLTYNNKTYNSSDMSAGGIAAKYERLKRENASNIRTITGASLTNPVVVTSVTHGFSNGDRVNHAGVGGTVELVGVYTIGNVTADTYELAGIDGTAWTAFTSGGSATLMCEWTSIDNTINELSAADFLALSNALGNYSDLCFRAARTHKNNISALTDTASVDAYDITVNWPSNAY